ncbi:phosphoenolpyruvate synthase [Paenibacillus sp. J5C_2022]|uniref:phosphoenolpyruvate synthase n=1 Tax=Paenibacillus sp. J5C2022 TaxID=2977129 RepID=UPI0021D36FD4|nr:phosphoenolpyruvate synthase [Paenibacillus sp. J5C2022]MCU6709107.1 phosphoenolpyruvate synthase [Paenibacillus sp. J5C2022]
MDKYVLSFREIDKSCLPYVGGKGANLGEMSQAGFPVPDGFCVTTYAYQVLLLGSEEIGELLERLDELRQEDSDGIKEWGGRIREHILSMTMPEQMEHAILDAWTNSGSDKAYAVRSSATAEDLPTASFAGQQDTYLNVRGQEQLLHAVQRCWASLFTDRAILYRIKNRFDHRSVFLSVVVQQMVFPEVSGIMFTADPISGRRGTVSIDASFGLGEALVSGLVSADLYQVRGGKLLKKQISRKRTAIYSLPEGGTMTTDIPEQDQEKQALRDANILELAKLGQSIEAHYGSEQDIEWGLEGDKLYILQSRPITTLYPVPELPDEEWRVLLSFGHIQMMTDPMRPLALSFISKLPGFLKEDPDSVDSFFFYPSGGRMFIDFTGPLKMKPARKVILKVLGSMDAKLAAAAAEAVQHEGFQSGKLPGKAVRRMAGKLVPIAFDRVMQVMRHKKADPEKVAAWGDAFIEEAVVKHERAIAEATGAERLARIRQQLGILLPQVVTKVATGLVVGVQTAGALKRELTSLFGEKQAEQYMSQLNKSLPGNVTSEMGLELGDLADLARQHPEVAEYLQRAEAKDFQERLLACRGGQAFRQALEAFLRKHGMRCSGEIDITKPRWYEDPTLILPSLLSHMRTSSNGEHRRKFQQGVKEAEVAERHILEQTGAMKRGKLKKAIKRYRYLMGMREHHKYAVIRHFALYKKVIMEEARKLAKKGVLAEEQDVYFLTMEELIALVDGTFYRDVRSMVEERKHQHESNLEREVPRVMTSEGEVLTGKVKGGKAPEGALEGTAVSAGIVEGVARVIMKPEDAQLNAGEILVAPFTDPGWTPLFASAVGLVIEVGGLMSHGSVIAREYGIPAVAGIDNATSVIKDGARIRLNGTEGYVQILE